MNPNNDSHEITLVVAGGRTYAVRGSTRHTICDGRAHVICDDTHTYNHDIMKLAIEAIKYQDDCGHFGGIYTVKIEQGEVIRVICRSLTPPLACGPCAMPILRPRMTWSKTMVGSRVDEQSERISVVKQYGTGSIIQMTSGIRTIDDISQSMRVAIRELVCDDDKPDGVYTMIATHDGFAISLNPTAYNELLEVYDEDEDEYDDDDDGDDDEWDADEFDDDESQHVVYLRFSFTKTPDVINFDTDNIYTDPTVGKTITVGQIAKLSGLLTLDQWLLHGTYTFELFMVPNDGSHGITITLTQLDQPNADTKGFGDIDHVLVASKLMTGIMKIFKLDTDSPT